MILCVWDINGELIVSQNLAGDSSDFVNVCVFFEGRPNEVFDSDLFFSGHRSGAINIWQKVFSLESKSWTLNHVHQLTLPNVTASINYLTFAPNQRYLLSGDSKGRLRGWMLPDGSGTELHFIQSDNCNGCNARFAVLGRRSPCRACGGSFCSTCLQPTTILNLKLCPACSKITKESEIKK
jgi:WD40 repeat protein